VFKLVSDTAFDGYSRSFDGITITEISSFEIVSLVIADGDTALFTKAYKKYLGKSLPAPGSWTKFKSGKILWTGQNQYFLIQDGIDDRLDETLSDSFGNTAYLTLQSDGWASLEISGERVHDVLERILTLDIRAKDTGFGTRSSAHHMSVLILKTGTSVYQLLTPRSSSAAFLEALEHVADNVLNS